MCYVSGAMWSVGRVFQLILSLRFVKAYAHASGLADKF